MKKQKPNNSSMIHKQDNVSLNKKSDTQSKQKEILEDRLSTLFQSSKSIQELYKNVEKLISYELQIEREKVLEEVREIIESCLCACPTSKWSILDYNELLSKIKELKKK